MAETANHGPLSAATVRALSDKLYEKRKGAALEIEKLVREYVGANQLTQVDRVLEVLKELAASHNPHTRKGGLIGLAAAAIALGRLTPQYTQHLILPILDCFNDLDARVRYYACESLYNVVKVTREAALIHFGVLFDTLARLAADTDQNVRGGGELLDRLLKDIVTTTSSFRVADFMVLLRERIHTKNSNTRRFLVSWLNCLSTVPDIKLLPFLPEILDGLFQTLSDPTQMVREMCEGVLGQFLQNIKQHPDQLDLQHMANVLIVHAQSPDDLVKYIALLWMREFLFIAKAKMLCFASGYMIAILPCLASTDERHRDIYDVAKEINIQLMRISNEANADVKQNLDLKSVADVLQNHLNHEAVQTRVAVLKWIHHMHQKMPTEVYPYMERLFPVLLKMLSDSSDEVVLLDLEVLSEVCQDTVSSSQLNLDSLHLPESAVTALANTSPYFVKFAASLLNLFRNDLDLLHVRGSFIVRQLCLLLKAEEIVRTLSVLLSHDTDLVFVAQMVQSLNAILFTATELFRLRQQLRQLDTKESRDLFCCIYRCWSHQPVALVGLCLLAQHYAHASQLIHHFANLDVTVDFLTEVDKLIQLLESPIFASLRLHLLDPEHQNHLSSVLYGFLMLLPQTEAFHTLHRRLQCLPIVAGSAMMADPRKKSPEKKRAADIPFESLLQHFLEIQDKHKQFRRLKHREMLAKSA